ncbi:MAG: DUF2334 domain-containing protein [Candidatus Pacearchaeota archaeon]
MLLNKIAKIIVFIIIFSIFLLFVVRLISPREVDDVHPEIPCEESILKKSDVLWIIPLFNNKKISENKEWCKYILSLNKTIGLHGVYHTYKEFDSKRTEEYLENGIKEFEKCFGFRPTMFKAPQLEIIKENKIMLKKKGIVLKGNFNQLIRKVYHCTDNRGVKGVFPNWFVDIF